MASDSRTRFFSSTTLAGGFCSSSWLNPGIPSNSKVSIVAFSGRAWLPRAVWHDYTTLGEDCRRFQRCEQFCSCRLLVLLSWFNEGTRLADLLTSDSFSFSMVL